MSSVKCESLFSVRSTMKVGQACIAVRDIFYDKVYYGFLALGIHEFILYIAGKWKDIES